MKSDSIEIHPGTPADVEWICAQGTEFNARHRSLWPGFPYEGPYDPAKFMACAFGEHRRFETLVAWRDQSRIGYACYSWGFNTERSASGMHLIELWVIAPERRRGVGRALMDRIVQICRVGGGTWVQWEVLRFDQEVLAFYKNYGGEEMAASIFMQLNLEGG